MALALQKQYDFYLSNESELLRLYQGMHLIISDDLHVFAFSSKGDACLFGAKEFGMGHFMLQYCDPETTRTVNHINLRTID